MSINYRSCSFLLFIVRRENVHVLVFYDEPVQELTHYSRKSWNSYLFKLRVHLGLFFISFDISCEILAAIIGGTNVKLVSL